jgi:hypothetical protein
MFRLAVLRGPACDARERLRLGLVVLLLILLICRLAVLCGAACDAEEWLCLGLLDILLILLMCCVVAVCAAAQEAQGAKGSQGQPGYSRGRC